MQCLLRGETGEGAWLTVMGAKRASGHRPGTVTTPARHPQRPAVAFRLFGPSPEGAKELAVPPSKFSGSSTPSRGKFHSVAVSYRRSLPLLGKLVLYPHPRRDLAKRHRSHQTAWWRLRQRILDQVGQRDHQRGVITRHQADIEPLHSLVSGVERDRYGTNLVW